MPFSTYLNSKREACRKLVELLGRDYEYVSILGTDIKATMYRADRNISMIKEGEGECGFVVKLHNKKAFFEYSFDDISENIEDIVQKIKESFVFDRGVDDLMIETDAVKDEPLRKDFTRESDFENYTDSEILEFCKNVRDDLLKKDEHFVNVIVSLQPYTVSKLFISKNRELSQHYGWVYGGVYGFYNDEKMIMAADSAYSYLLSEAMPKLAQLTEPLCERAKKLVKAKPIEPGIYDVITDSSITGLIAHEAFGHGVEMDQFVKDRALAKKYVGKYIASPITNMRDGAAATLSAASYFFDDDGVLAHDTQIIKNGVLVSGLSDLVSATELSTAPSGNGRRESFKRKAYSRMTNTFFEPGSDKLSDMIKSVKHGYMLFQTNNGMEDPKNWQIQCTAEYGIEIVDGKLTDNYVSPVVMSGFVPDLLGSISMVSDNFEVIGAGMCGKGHKEWVYVSDGGPNLKVRVKLG